MNQPKALYIISLIQMGKFFSQYGMRALLILFMIEALHLSDSHSFGMNAVFLCLTELCGVLGGWAADRFLGVRRASMYGALILSAGYLSLLLPKGLYIALSLIILGGSLFAGNIIALLGEAYEQEDLRRKPGFTFFYMMQNLGALLSTMICGIVSQHVGYRAGFALASLGMLFSASLFCFGKRVLKPLGHAPARKKPKAILFVLSCLIPLSLLGLRFETVVFPLLPWIATAIFIFFAIKLLKDKELPKFRTRLFLVYLIALVLFFAMADQSCSSLIVFSERNAERTFLGWLLPSSVLISVNPLVILTLGTLMGKMRLKISLAFLIAALSFAALAYLCFQEIPISIFAVMGVVVLISIAELIVAPVVYTYASEVASLGKAGIVMGMLPLAYSLSYVFSGAISKWLSIEEGDPSLFIYASGFLKITWAAFAGGIILEIFIRLVGNAKRAVS